MLQNTGTVAGDEVVFLFKKSDAPTTAWNAARNLGPPTLPAKELIGFERVSLAPGSSTVVHFNTTAAKLSSVDGFGTRHVLGGTHELIFSRGHGEELSLPLGVELASGSEAAAAGRLVISTMVGMFGKGEEELGLGAHQEL